MSDAPPVELLAGPEHDGQRLDRVLAPAAGSRAAAQKAIAAGDATVDGRAAAKSHVVRAGEALSVRVVVARPRLPGEDRTTTPASRDLEEATAPRREAADAPEVVVRHEDEHLLVVDKPAGMLVHPGAGDHGTTLVDVLSRRAGAGPAGGDDPERPGVVHRLDRDTSGLLLVARDAEAHRRLQAAIQAREVRREYLALVEGRPESRTGTIEAPIGRDPHHRTRMAVAGERGRDAVTHFAIEEALQRTTLLRVRLETGRTHQIRVHLQAIGLPVCGDQDYGREGGAGVELGLERQFLHATRLSFAHPVSGEELVVDSPLPADLAAVLDDLPR